MLVSTILTRIREGKKTHTINVSGNIQIVDSEKNQSPSTKQGH